MFISDSSYRQVWGLALGFRSWFSWFGAKIEVLNHLQKDPRTIAEHGSTIKINGKPTPTQNLDVEQLYSNIMKSIK